MTTNSRISATVVLFAIVGAIAFALFAGWGACGTC